MIEVSITDVAQDKHANNILLKYHNRVGYSFEYSLFMDGIKYFYPKSVENDLIDIPFLLNPTRSYPSFHPTNHIPEDIHYRVRCYQLTDGEVSGIKLFLL